MKKFLFWFKNVKDTRRENTPSKLKLLQKVRIWIFG